jgi:hypothetical protein
MSGSAGLCGDQDGDGVLDAGDACLPTPLGEVVNAEGCSLDEFVPCIHHAAGEKWKNHGAYVCSVARAAGDFLELGPITEAERDSIVSAAAQSNCG